MELGLSKNNAIVIGSGILNALGIRESKDIDVVVSADKFQELFRDLRLKKTESLGVGILTNEIFEIGTGWKMTNYDMNYEFDDLFKESTVIEGVRYISLEFLLKIKKIWVSGMNPRLKDIQDVKLIEKYLQKSK